jgi:hypothetical protein
LLLAFAFLLVLFPLSSSSAAEPDCIQNTPGEDVVSHIHVKVQLHVTFEGGQGQETIVRPFPFKGLLGISLGCMKEIHTHDGTGVLHIESKDASKFFTFGDFLDLILQEQKLVIEFSSGEKPKVTVNNTIAENYREVRLEDDMTITIFFNLTNNKTET